MFDLQTMIQFIDSSLNSWWFLALQIFGGIVSFVFLIAVIYFTYKNGNIQRQIRHLWISWNKTPIPKHTMTKQWARIKEKAGSDSPGLWREAILEADFMLDQMLRKIGYKGSTTEERLENIRVEQFPSFQEAFKAHRVADFIAEDLSYPLTREVADKTMEIYRNVFRETGIII